LGQALTVTAQEQSVEGRRHTNTGEIRNASNEVLARGTATFIAIDPEKIFARYGRPADLGVPSADGTKA
jgi:acyl-CoA thioesterase FadM